MPSFPAIFDVEWLNANSQRKYPLHEECTLRDDSDSITLPDDFLVDMILPVHIDTDVLPENFHVHSVAIFGSGVTLTLGYDGDAIGSVTINTDTFERNKQYIVQGIGDFFDTVGKVVIGSLDNIMLYAGSYTFNPNDAKLAPTVVKPDIRGVSAIYLQNGSDRTSAIQGDVILQAGRNMFISFISAAGTEADPHRIIFNAINGQGLNSTCGCSESSDAPCIETINGIIPDAGTGNFNLLDSECISLESIANGLKITDDCSTPCCGCEELKVVKQTMEHVVSQLNSLENLASRLEGALATLQFNLLSSDPFGRG